MIEEAQGRRHLPAPRLHPGEGAAAGPRRGAADGARDREGVRDRRGRADLDLAASLVRKQKVVDRLTKGLETLLKGREVTVVPGSGTVVDVADGAWCGSRVEQDGAADVTELTGDTLILATGSTPGRCPGIDFDGEVILSSDHLLERDRVPGRPRSSAADAIGCEFASYLGDVGSEVTVLEAMPVVLPGVDPQAADVVGRAFRRRKIKVLTGVSVDGVDRGASADAAATVRYSADGAAQTLDVDVVVVSVGRRPRSGGIGLEGTGVEVDSAWVRGRRRSHAHRRTGRVRSRRSRADTRVGARGIRRGDRSRSARSWARTSDWARTRNAGARHLRCSRRCGQAAWSTVTRCSNGSALGVRRPRRSHRGEACLLARSAR